VPDADIQAVSFLGELAFLAATYQADPTSTAGQEALAKFQQIYGFFHINGNTVTFDYNNGTQLGVAITDPGALAILKQMPTLSNPPTGADLGKYLTNFWYATPADPLTQPIVEQVMSYYDETTFAMGANLDNPTTNSAVLLFYLSTANVPGAGFAAILDKNILQVTNGMIEEGGLYGVADALCAQLASDNNFLNPAMIAAGLSIPTKDPRYQDLGIYFTANYQTLMNQNPGELAWVWEARLFPSSRTDAASTQVDAPPLSRHSAEDERNKVTAQLDRYLDLKTIKNQRI
jgi:hypothetical protein